MRVVPFSLLALISASFMLTACGGGGGSSGGSGTGSAPLSAANRDAAAADAASLSLDGSLALSLGGYYVPAATVAVPTNQAPSRLSLRQLGELLVRQAQTRALGGARSSTFANVASAPIGVMSAAASTVETVPCDGGGSYTLTSLDGSATWVYSACIDAEGITLNGQVASVQLDDLSYQGDFTHFSVALPDETPVGVNGRLIYSSNATATELQAPQLSLAMSGFSLTLGDYLWRATDTGTETKLEARGRATTTGNTGYSIAFDNLSDDADQAPFYVADGDTYPYTGSLEIQDNLSANRIVLHAMNSAQALLEFTLSGQASSTWTLWSELL